MWSNPIIKHSTRFIILLLFQAFMLSQLEISVWIYPMIYPLFILLLPVDMNRFTIILLSVFFGVCLDFFSNTYGLHASSLLVVAFARRYILKIMEKREGYEPNSEPGLQMGFPWLFSFVGLLIFIHHLWFFTFEIFRWDMIIFILIKTFISSIISVIIIFSIFLLFYRSKKT